MRSIGNIMRILVTGSAGFIGHHVTASLLERGYFVFGVDNLNDYYSPKLKEYRNKLLDSQPNYQFIIGDISNRDFVKDLFISYKFDAVIHLAAQAGVRLPLDENYKYTQSNLVGFENIASNVLINNIKVFAYASSSSVYGNVAKTPLSESENLLKPNSYYGVTKLSNEMASNVIFKNSVTKTRGLRFFSVYGPMGRPDMAYFKLIANSVNGEEFNLFGDGTVRRDFTYIDDVVIATLRLLDQLFLEPKEVNDVVNVGGGQPFSMNELIKIIENISFKKIRIRNLPASALDSILTEADTALLNELTNFKPQTSLEFGIQKTYDWWLRVLESEGQVDWVGE